MTQARRARLALEPSPAARALAGFVLAVTVVVSLAPFFYVISTSLKETKSLFGYPPRWIPDPPYLGNYTGLFEAHPFGWWMLNTIVVSVVVTALKLVIDGMAAYALAKLDFTG